MYLKSLGCLENASCIYCSYAEHSLEHMLWDCVNVQKLWMIVKQVLGVDLNFKSIVLGLQVEFYDNVLSLICYLIYKKYLIDRDKNYRIALLSFIRNEILYREKIYNLKPNCQVRVFLENIATKSNDKCL